MSKQLYRLLELCNLNFMEQTATYPLARATWAHDLSSAVLNMVTTGQSLGLNRAISYPGFVHRAPGKKLPVNCIWCLLSSRPLIATASVPKMVTISVLCWSPFQSYTTGFLHGHYVTYCFGINY